MTVSDIVDAFYDNATNTCVVTRGEVSCDWV